MGGEYVVNGHGPVAAVEAEDVKKVLQLVGCKNFVRSNPMSERFAVRRFHHIEFWCPDATNAYRRFLLGLGMRLVAKSDQSTGNKAFASYVLQSNDLVFAFTAPYSKKMAGNSVEEDLPYLNFDAERMHEFSNTHGFGVRAVGVEVENARKAFDISVANGAKPVGAPKDLIDKTTGHTQVVSEVALYGDVVLRYVSGSFAGPYLAGFDTTLDTANINYGLKRLDHAVGNVHNLLETANYIMKFTGFHEFAEFTAEDVGTVESGLNSMVLANNSEKVLLPVNEPTFGTRRKSQIQTYLEQNEGPGLQHLALKTDDVIATLTQMRQVSEYGGFEFMPRPSKDYYKKLPAKIGNALTPAQYKAIEELGILADKDDQGTLLQIFTKPVSDRPTIFLEIIQRIGCETVMEGEDGVVRTEQAGGCGGFGKGNFSELFKSIEDYEKSLDV